MTTTATTKNAPAELQLDEGKDRTINRQEEGAAMPMVSETTPNAKDSHPAWCTSHYKSDDDVIHKGRVEVGETYALIERDYEGHEIGVPDNDGFYSPQEARDLAAALTKAADLVEQGEAKKAGQAAQTQTHPDWCDLGADCTDPVHLGDRVHEGRGTGTCPSWCAKHVTDPDFGVVHQRLVTVRDMTVSVELGSEGPAIFMPETLEITPSQAVSLAAALVGALALLEDVDQ